MHKKTRDEPPAFAGRLIGYARVSTPDQDVAMQVTALRHAGVQEDNIWYETASGVKANRPQRDLALLDARAGDVFVVYKLDRFGRSFIDLLRAVEALEKRGVGFRSLTEGFDTTKAGGRFLFHVIGAGAQFERDMIVERTRDGMAEAKRRGVVLGAPKWFDAKRQKEFERRFLKGESVTKIAKSWGKSANMIRSHYKKERLKALRRRPKRKAK